MFVLGELTARMGVLVVSFNIKIINLRGVWI